MVGGAGIDPTTWFEVISTNSTIQLKQPLATLAAFANPK
jgi:hypothetical protein